MENGERRDGPGRNDPGGKTNQNTAPAVSVIVPIMNVESYLPAALDSLAAQTLENTEFILLNDGSTDGSLRIMEEYAERDSRFHLIDKENTGYGSTMNIGIEAARGEYIGILEPDDYADPGMFERLYREAAENDLDFVKSDYILFTAGADGTIREKTVRLSLDDSFYGRTLCPGEEKQTFFFPINTWTGIYRKAFLDRHGIRHHETPGASFQDNGFWFQTFCHGKRVRFIREALYHYRGDNPNSSMMSRKKERCITEEYRWIHEGLASDPAMLKQFEGIMYDKQYLSMLLTLSRLEADRKQPYLHHIREELETPYRERLFDRRFLHPLDWEKLDRIMEDPEEYGRGIDVSVIIPVYNAEAYLEECLHSILFRSNVRIEVICVDDGSTDGSGEILRRMAEADSRIRVCATENRGAGAARNEGLKHARGEYLAFLDADDFFEPDMLDKAWNAAKTSGLDLIVFPGDNYDEETRAFTPLQNCQQRLLPRKKPFAGKDVKRDLFRLFIGWTWDKLFRTEWIRQTGLAFAEIRSSNDLSFTFGAAAAAGRTDWLGGPPLAHHRQHGGSISVSREKTWDCFYHALKALKENLEKLGLYERFERDYGNYCLHFSLWQMLTVDETAGEKMYRKLTEEWFEEFGLTDRPAGWFYDPREYEMMQRMREVPAAEFRKEWQDRVRGGSEQAEPKEKTHGQLAQIPKKIRTGIWMLRVQGAGAVWQYGKQKGRALLPKGKKKQE